MRFQNPKFNLIWAGILLTLCMGASHLFAQGFGEGTPFPGFGMPEPPAEMIEEDTLAPPEPQSPETQSQDPLNDLFQASEPQAVPEFKRYIKKIVPVPSALDRNQVNPDDFRDPFFLLRTLDDDPKEVLDPGTTPDGIRFNATNDSTHFAEKVYKDSNFKLDDVYGRVPTDNRDEGCQFCHHGIEEISPNHKMTCTKCHGGNDRTRNQYRAHREMVANPSDLAHAPKYCGSCHPGQVAGVLASGKADAKNIIDITHHAWGVEPPIWKGPTPLTTTEEISEKPETEKAGATAEEETKIAADETVSENQSPPLPVKEFMNKKCLRCHLNAPAPHRAGDYRATGCAACHMIYTNDGITLTRDRAVMRKQKSRLLNEPGRFQREYAMNALKNPRGYPVVHKFTTVVPSVQCEHCHNQNGVGDEYEGLFARIARPRDHRTDIEKGTPLLHGKSHDFLVPDIHREKGLHCIDCHAVSMKEGTDGEQRHSTISVQCIDCHGDGKNDLPEFSLDGDDPETKRLLTLKQLNPNLARKIRKKTKVLQTQSGEPLVHIIMKENGWYLISKVDGQLHLIPELKNAKRKPIAHQVARHMDTVECSACHARWSASELGFHAIKENNSQNSMWKDWSLGDPVRQQALIDYERGITPTPEDAQGMLNWTESKSGIDGIKGPRKSGVWTTLFSDTDWNKLILGKNARGKYSILKPRYQYFFTDHTGAENSGTLLDRVPVTQNGLPGWVWTPHTPHTIRKTARTCEACHNNSMAVGLGEDLFERVTSGTQFLESLKSQKKLQEGFQWRQLVAEDGTPIQSVLPEPARTLNKEEIDLLMNPSEAYRSYRHLDLKEKRFSHLLHRNVFPYDKQKILNQRKYGLPARKEDWYYDEKDNRFIQAREVVLPDPESLPQPEASGEIFESNKVEDNTLREFNPDSFSNSGEEAKP